MGMMSRSDVAETLIVGIERHDLVGTDVAETLVVGIERHDLVGSDVAETLVVGIESRSRLTPNLPRR